MSWLRAHLARHARSQFCREHGLDARTTLTEYRARVPIRRHNELAPWLERACSEQPHVLTCERVIRAARTAGSTAAPKHIPITRSQIRAFMAAQELWTQSALRDAPEAGRGTILVLASPRTQGRLASGLAFGSPTGLGYVRDGPLADRVRATPSDISTLRDPDARLYLTLAHALQHDLSALIAVHPSTLVLLFQRLAQWGEALVRDMMSGHYHFNGEPLPPQLVTHTQRAIPRAEQLRAVLKRQPLTPARAWPQLALLGCWRAGPSALYLPELHRLSRGLPVRDLGYAASEGWIAPTLCSAGAFGVPMIHHYLIELIPPEATAQALPIPLCDTQPGEPYRLVVTSPGGLYRYDTEDIVEVVGRIGQAPLLAFRRRAGSVSSLVGEKLSEAQLIMAIRRTAAVLDMQLQDFTAKPIAAAGTREAAQYHDTLAHYCFWVTFQTPPTAIEHFIRQLDITLGEVNVEYRQKRQTQRLGPATVKPVSLDALERQRTELRIAPPPADAQRKRKHLLLG